MILFTRFCKLLTRVATPSGGTCLKCLNGTTPLKAIYTYYVLSSSQWFTENSQFCMLYATNGASHTLLDLYAVVGATHTGSIYLFRMKSYGIGQNKIK